jgi:hypothetical protein
MKIFIYILISAALGTAHADVVGQNALVNFNCQQAYLSELWRLSDLQNSDEAREARKTLAQKDRRFMVGAAAGTVAGVILGSTWAKRANDGLVSDVDRVVLPSVGGMLAGESLGTVLAGKKTRQKEKQAAEYLNELNTLYGNMRDSYRLVLGSMILGDQQAYTPAEVKKSYDRLASFLDHAEIPLTVDAAAAKVRAGDESSELCPNGTPMDESSLIQWLRR